MESSSSSKNLKGLFNLIRTEFKDVRKELQKLEETVASRTDLVNGLEGGKSRESGDRDEILAALRRIESLLKEKTDHAKINASEKLGEQEARLLRSLLKDTEEEIASETIARNGDINQAVSSSDCGVSTPIGSGASSSCERRTEDPPANLQPINPERVFHAARPTQDPAKAKEAIPETDQDTSGFIRDSNSEFDHRIDAMSSQIEHLKEGQQEILAMLKGLYVRSATEEKAPVIVPPPRKVGRKVVGFVYEDDGHDP